MVKKDRLTKELSSSFPQDLVEGLIDYYQEVVRSAAQGHWEDALTKAGKFIERTLDCLHYKQFGKKKGNKGVGRVIDDLIKLPKETPATIKTLIPRACRIIYEITSNRGGRHDKPDFDANRMDATYVLSGISWILAEFIRFFHPTESDPHKCQKIADELVAKKYPYIEEIDGVEHISIDGLSCRETMLVTLSLFGDMKRDDLSKRTIENEFTPANVSTNISRMRKANEISTPSDGTIVLRRNGKIKADKILEEKGH